MKNNETNRGGSKKATEEKNQNRAWRATEYASVFYSDEELYDQSAPFAFSPGDLFWTYYRMLVAVRA